MKKNKKTFFELKNDEMFDALGEISLILEDLATREDVMNAKTTMERFRALISKDNRGKLMELIATLDGEEVETYELTADDLKNKVFAILKDKELTELISFFS